MIMFSTSRKDQPFFIVPSGIVPWEDLRAIADPQWNTVSLISGTLSAAIPPLWALVASKPPRLTRVFQVSAALVAPEWTNFQKRRFFAKLKKDQPGFSETTTLLADTHVCITSTLSDPSAVDPGSLTSYRHSALVEVEDGAFERLQAVCATLTDLGGSGISTLLNGAGSPAILRALELETHSVIQLIGASDVSDLAVQCLADRHIRQVNDIRNYPGQFIRRS
jgi:hypothetical protein